MKNSVAIQPPEVLRITTDILDEELINIPQRILRWADECRKLAETIIRGMQQDLINRGYVPVKVLSCRDNRTLATIYQVVGVRNATK